MANDLAILMTRRLVSRSMWRFFYENNAEYRIPNLTPEEAKARGITDAFAAYMKAHEGDWLRSESFQKMFLECNPMFLAHLSKFFYGDGAVVKDGVNLSERVIECLKETEKFYGQEQATFARATFANVLIKAFEHKKEQGKKEAPDGPQA